MKQFIINYLLSDKAEETAIKFFFTMEIVLLVSMAIISVVKWN